VEPSSGRCASGGDYAHGRVRRENPGGSHHRHLAYMRLNKPKEGCRCSIDIFQPMLYEMVTGQRPFRGSRVSSWRQFKRGAGAGGAVPTICKSSLRVLRKMPERRQNMADLRWRCRIQGGIRLRELTTTEPALPVRRRWSPILLTEWCSSFCCCRGRLLAWAEERPHDDALTLVPLTSFPPRTSSEPAGRSQVAFNWNGPGEQLRHLRETGGWSWPRAANDGPGPRTLPRSVA
jgi:hypothetical protein